MHAIETAHRTSMRRGFRALLGALVASALLLSACGGIGEGPEANGPAAGGGQDGDGSPSVVQPGDPGGDGGSDEVPYPDSQPTQCGQSPATIPASAPPDYAVGNTNCDEPGDEPKGQPTPVTPHPGMANLHRVGWDKVIVGKDDRTLTVIYWSGIEPCNVLDHVDVQYRANEVEIVLFEGHDPDQNDVPCIEIAVQKSVEIVLDEPLAGRDIVDGTEDKE